MAHPVPTDPREDYATPALLVFMTAAAAVVLGLIVLYAVVAEWWLLPVTLIALVLGTVGVAYAIARALGD
jgi:hypothetical protein